MKSIKNLLKGIDEERTRGSQKSLFSIDEIPTRILSKDMFFDKKRKYFVTLDGKKQTYAFLGLCNENPLIESRWGSSPFGFNLSKESPEYISDYNTKILQGAEEKVKKGLAKEYVVLFDVTKSCEHLFDNITVVPICELEGYEDISRVIYSSSFMNNWIGKIVTQDDIVTLSVGIFDLPENLGVKMDCFERASILNQIMERFDEKDLTSDEKQFMSKLKFNAASMLCDQASRVAWENYFCKCSKYKTKEDDNKALKLYNKCVEKIKVYSKSDDFGFYMETCKNLCDGLNNEIETKYIKKDDKQQDEPTPAHTMGGEN